MRRGWTAGWLAAALAAHWAAEAADPEAAARRYGSAVRLLGESAEDVAPLLREVVELDPKGALADDALIELALVEGIPRWPEEVGRISAAALQKSLPLLDQILAGLPDADRADEARYLRGLLASEPLAASSPTSARSFFLGAMRGTDDRWRRAARYASGWLYLRDGRRDRAIEVFHALLADGTGGQVAARARVSLARCLLAEGDYGEAARLLQQAIDAGVSGDALAEAHRELAVRSLLADVDAMAAARPQPVVTTRIPAGAAAGMVPTPDGGIVLGDRRHDRIVAFDARGGARSVWEVADLEAVAGDRAGGVWAAAGGYVYRVLAGNSRLQRVAATGEWSPVAGLAADASGAVWILDRRGRIARIAAGSMAPVPLWQSASGRASSIAWDGRRLLVGDERQGTVVAVRADGTSSPLVEQGFERPGAITADASGRFAVLDARAGYVYVHRPDGTVVDAYSFRTDGIERPSAIALGLDGSLHVHDDQGPSWMRRP